jgi:uncharacterized membrane protein
MSVCARCIGATIGQVAAIVVAVIWTLPPWWVNAALLALMLIDWGVQEYAGILSTNRRRLMTGLAGGFGFTAIAIRLLMWIVPIIWNAVF